MRNFLSCPTHPKFPGKHSSYKLTLFSSRGIFNTLIVQNLGICCGGIPGDLQSINSVALSWHPEMGSISTHRFYFLLWAFVTENVPSKLITLLLHRPSVLWSSFSFVSRKIIRHYELLDTLPVLEFQRPVLKAVFPQFLKTYAQRFPEPNFILLYPRPVLPEGTAKCNLFSPRCFSKHSFTLCFFIVQAWTNFRYENGSEIIPFCHYFFFATEDMTDCSPTFFR